MDMLSSLSGEKGKKNLNSFPPNWKETKEDKHTEKDFFNNNCCSRFN